MKSVIRSARSYVLSFAPSFVISFVLSLTLSFASSLAQAEIREIKTMREAETYIAAGSTVVFDLDNTVLETRQMLGSDPFFTHLLKKAKALGLVGEAATDWAIARNALVQPHSPVRAVEPATPHFIETLQRRGLNVFALTARPEAWATGTLTQLRGIGVDFRATAPAGLRDGIQFLPKGRTKGEQLLKLLAERVPTADKVIFIDDKLHHVESVDRALTAAGFSVMSLRYGAADPAVAAFDPRIADFQWEFFLKYGVFLSDAAARSLLKH